VTGNYAELANAIRAIGSSGFHAAMERLLRLEIRFDNYLEIAYFGEQPPTVLYRSSQSRYVHAELDSRYVPSLYLLDPFYTAHLGKIPVGAYRLLDLAPDKFRMTSYHLEYYQRTTLIDEIAFFAYVSNGWTINICIGRDETSEATFRKIDRENARRIAPAVAAFLERHFAISPIARREVSSGSGAGLLSWLEEARGIRITPRQAQVAMLLLRGHSSKSIGRELGISWQTVRVFRKQLYRRCGVSSQAELFALLTPLAYAGSLGRP